MEQFVSHLLYMRNEDGARVIDPIFVAFDCLFARGKDLRDKPLKARRRVLERELKGAQGPILIAKLESSIYEPGKRTSSWIKAKHRIRQGWPEEKIERRRE